MRILQYEIFTNYTLHYDPEVDSEILKLKNSTNIKCEKMSISE